MSSWDITFWLNDTIGETKDCETSIQEVKQAWLFQLFILMLYVKASITYCLIKFAFWLMSVGILL